MSTRKVHTGERLIRPTRLQSGSRIAVVAPAGCVRPEQLEAGVALLETSGYRVLLSPEIFQSRRYFAGSDSRRAGLLQELMAEPNVDALFCARGGFGSMRTLPLINFETIRRFPKVLVGFSDVSALLSTVYFRCGLVTLHGPTVTTLATCEPESRGSLLDVLAGRKPPSLKSAGHRVVQAGRAVGPVLAGNLTTLCHLVGTPFQPQLEDHILLLEDCSEAPYRIDRMLSQMKQAGCLDGLAGLGLGLFQDCGAEELILEIVQDVIDDSSLPMLAGLPVGHGPANMTVPNGIDAVLDTRKGELSFCDPATV